MKEKEHNYPDDVVEYGEKYLDKNKTSFVGWGDLEEFIREHREHPNFKRKVEKYCIYKALEENVLTEKKDKNFFLYEGSKPSIDGCSLFFRKLNAIEEYRKETNQEKKSIAMLLD